MNPVGSHHPPTQIKTDKIAVYLYPATDLYARGVHAWQVRLLYARAPLDATASLLIAPLLVLIVWNVMPHPMLLAWLTLLETTIGIRSSIILAFQRRSLAVDEQPAKWAARYIWANMATAICWGGTVVLLAYSPAPLYDALIALILGGLLMGGVLTLASVLNAYLTYALPLSLPLIFWWLLRDDLIYAILGVAGLLHLLLAVGIAYRNHQSLCQSLRLALENNELIQSFTNARKRAEEERQRQERMAIASRQQQTLLAHASRLNTLGEMTSGLVHEINQPITAITLYTEVGLARLRNRSFEGDELQQILEKIAAQSTRASAIIQQIRRFARQGKPQYAPVCIRDLLDEIADFLDLEAQRHAVCIRYDASAELPAVLADALQIQQVILNLVRNALDAMRGGEEICMVVISAHLNQETVEITVQDTGPGLEPGVIGQLLNPFFTTKPSGLGLGLPISQSIIETHGGRLWVTANSGPGVTFHFTLPVAARTEWPKRTPPPLSVEAG